MDVYRTLPIHVPRKRAGTSRHPRVRWWRIAIDHLTRLMNDPVRTWSTPTYRAIDILDGGGFKIDRGSGLLELYRMAQQGRHLQRVTRHGADTLLIGGQIGQGWIGGLISRDAVRWAYMAGMPLGQINSQWRRLLAWLARCWRVDGTIDRWRQMEARALALDVDVVRLVLATTSTEHGPDAVFFSRYNSCVADRANLLSLEREAPQLMRLYAYLLPGGAGKEEAKRELKRTFLDGGRRPVRLWRTMCRLDATTIDRLTAYEDYRSRDSMMELINLLQALDLPFQPPSDWLRFIWRLRNDGLVSLVFEMAHMAPMLAAHAKAWCEAPEGARPVLEGEFILVHDQLEEARPPVPDGIRKWAWWLKKARLWQTERAIRARDWDAAQTTKRCRPVMALSADGIELQPLLTGLALHEEGAAMANCIYDWREHLVGRTAVIYSVRASDSGKRLGTAAIEPCSVVSTSGFANQPLVEEVDRVVRTMLLREYPRIWPSRRSTKRHTMRRLPTAA